MNRIHEILSDLIGDLGQSESEEPEAGSMEGEGAEETCRTSLPSEERKTLSTASVQPSEAVQVQWKQQDRRSPQKQEIIPQQTAANWNAMNAQKHQDPLRQPMRPWRFPGRNKHS